MYKVDRSMTRFIVMIERAWHQGRNYTDRQGGRQGVVGGGWTRTTGREGEKGGGGGGVNRVAIPPSSKSEATSFHCLRYLS